MAVAGEVSVVVVSLVELSDSVVVSVELCVVLIGLVLAVDVDCELLSLTPGLV